MGEYGWCVESGNYQSGRAVSFWCVIDSGAASMTAAFDDRSIVRAQTSLMSLAYSTQSSSSRLSRQQQKKWDEVAWAISSDTVVCESLELASMAYPSALAEHWDRRARERIVGSGIAASLIWAMFWRWVFPMLLDLAERWLRDQLMAPVSATTTTVRHP